MSDARQLVRTSTAALRRAGVDSPEHDAVALLAHAWSVDAERVRHAMVVGGTPPQEVAHRLDVLVGQRSERVPLQHLTGWAGFRGLVLSVGPGVFVPRPETEGAVDLVLEGLGPGSLVVDLCTGSGALALAVKSERPDAVVHAVEVDPLAHAWALRNRERLGLDVTLRLGAAQQAFPDLLGEVDVVVSNPPYIPVGMVPQDPEVREHDPSVALYGGSEDGLRIPLEVADRARRLLRPGGRLVMEHADVQGRTLPRALEQRGWVAVVDHADLSGRPRTVTARTPSS